MAQLFFCTVEVVLSLSWVEAYSISMKQLSRCFPNWEELSFVSWMEESYMMKDVAICSPTSRKKSTFPSIPSQSRVRWRQWVEVKTLLFSSVFKLLCCAKFTLNWCQHYVFIRDLLKRCGLTDVFTFSVSLGQKAHFRNSHTGLESQTVCGICRWACRKMCR